MNPIDFGGQRSKAKVTIDKYGNKLVNNIEAKPLCASSSKLADIFTMISMIRIDPIDFGDQSSKVNVTIDKYGNKLVNTIETKPLCAFSSNLAYMLAIVRDMDLIDFGGQRSKAAIDKYGNKLQGLTNRFSNDLSDLDFSLPVI